MADAANLRSVRVQYLVADDSPALLRDVRLQTLESDASPAGIRRLTGQILTIAKDPLNLRSARAQFAEDFRNPASIRRVTTQFLVIEKYPVNLRGIRAQFMEAAASPTSIRRVNTQVMVRPRDQLNIATVRVQYLEVDNSSPDFSLVAWPKLLQIINDTNGFAFTQAMLLPGTPEVNTNPLYWNTKLLVTATPLSGFSGSMYVYYQRYPISEAFNKLAPLLDLTGKNTVYDVLPQLNANYDLALTSADVEDGPIDKATNSFKLKVKAGSWFFLEGTEFIYQNIYDMRDVFGKVDLNGWDLPPTTGGIKNAIVGVNGIYDVYADDGSTFKAYCDMTTDGGYWIQVGHWTGTVPTAADQILNSECIVKGLDIQGFTTDPTNRPVIKAGSLKNIAEEWMLQHDNPSWIATFGTWQVGKTVPATTPLWKAADPVPVRTSIGNKNLYGQRSGWYLDTAMTDNFGFFTTLGPGGPCGGAGTAGGNRMCPISDFAGSWGAHCDYTYNKRLFLRATNYKP
ncbi:hypothetical protein D3C84_459320 [compost metagenome]